MPETISCVLPNAKAFCASSHFLSTFKRPKHFALGARSFKILRSKERESFFFTKNLAIVISELGTLERPGITLPL